MTEYLVLQSTPAHPVLAVEKGETVTSFNEDLGWRAVGKVEARSSESAIRQLLDGKEAEGSFVAVPARSWKPVTVKVETKTALKFS